MLIRRVDVVNCPHCGAENPAREAHCGACSKGLTVYIGPAHNLPRRYGLGSLMLLVATVAVGLGALRGVPVLGVLILILVPASLVRTMAIVSQRAVDGRPMNAEERTGVFFGSIGVMMAVILASFLAFAIVCMPAGSMAMGAGGYGMPVALSLAVAAALAVAVWVLRKLWPYKG